MIRAVGKPAERMMLRSAPIRPGDRPNALEFRSFSTVGLDLRVDPGSVTPET